MMITVQRRQRGSYGRVSLLLPYRVVDREGDAPGNPLPFVSLLEKIRM